MHFRFVATFFICFYFDSEVTSQCVFHMTEFLFLSICMRSIAPVWVTARRSLRFVIINAQYSDSVHNTITYNLTRNLRGKKTFPFQLLRSIPPAVSLSLYTFFFFIFVNIYLQNCLNNILLFYLLLQFNLQCSTVACSQRTDDVIGTYNLIYNFHWIIKFTTEFRFGSLFFPSIIRAVRSVRESRAHVNCSRLDGQKWMHSAATAAINCSLLLHTQQCCWCALNAQDVLYASSALFSVALLNRRRNGMLVISSDAFRICTSFTQYQIFGIH